MIVVCNLFSTRCATILHKTQNRVSATSNAQVNLEIVRATKPRVGSTSVGNFRLVTANGSKHNFCTMYSRVLGWQR